MVLPIERTRTPAGSLQSISAALSRLMLSWSQTGHVLISFSRTLMPGGEKQLHKATGCPSWILSSSPFSSPVSVRGLGGKKTHKKPSRSSHEQRKHRPDHTGIKGEGGAIWSNSHGKTYRKPVLYLLFVNKTPFYKDPSSSTSTVPEVPHPQQESDLFLK